MDLSKGYTALDCETFLITDECKAPQLVCVSFYKPNSEPEVLAMRDARTKVFTTFETSLSEGSLIVGHSISYDLGVMCREWPDLIPLVFECFDKGLIYCTKVNESLIDNAEGVLYHAKTLAKCAKKYLDIDLDKSTNTARTFYGIYADIATKYWPQAVVDYANQDAVISGQVFEAQSNAPDAESILFDAARQAAYDFALNLISIWGFYLDQDFIADKTCYLNKRIQELKPDLLEVGILRPSGSIDMKKLRSIVVEAAEKEGKKVHRTAKGAIKTGKDEIREFSTPILKKVVDYKSCEKMLSTFLSHLEGKEAMHSRFNVLVATGRTSSSGINLQQIPSYGDHADMKKCFTARPGKALICADYAAAELRSLAQVMYELGIETDLLDEMNKPDSDPHMALGLEILGKVNPTDVEIKNARQSAKAANFGFPGGMGVDRFIESQEKRGLHIDRETAQELKNTWSKKWNMRPYFNHANELAERGVLVQHTSGRIRGGVRFCDSANSLFQGLTADGAKLSVYKVSKECYARPDSPLYGARIVNFVHDEIILECDTDKIHPCSERLTDIMVEGMSVFTPDVKPVVEVTAMKSWDKSAKEVRDEQGRLRCA